MGLFKKSKKEVRLEGKLPELPPLPEMNMPMFPELPKEEKEEKMPELPTLSSLPPLPALRLPTSFEQIKVPTKPMTIDINEERKGASEPVFVKIDKYRQAIAGLEMIKKKLHETSNLLEKIKETRQKEDEELEIWTQEISSIKEKIELIDRKLFSGI